ncbi:MAG: hypothetical protein DMG24_20115 [Acidobacteria bacterium]|nr:MAG: hypothetical protein DMG24_20115 [Acidobacteriota bacterium]
MDGKDLFRKLFEYDRWGNQQALASLSTVGEAVERPRKIFCHVLGAQQLWLSRFEAPQHPDVDPWPLLPLPACRAAVEELHQGWTALLDRLTAEQLAGDLVYRNTKGVEFKTPIQDVLMQLVMHRHALGLSSRAGCGGCPRSRGQAVADRLRGLGPSISGDREIVTRGW